MIGTGCALADGRAARMAARATKAQGRDFVATVSQCGQSTGLDAGALSGRRRVQGGRAATAFLPVGRGRNPAYCCGAAASAAAQRLLSGSAFGCGLHLAATPMMAFYRYAVVAAAPQRDARLPTSRWGKGAFRHAPLHSRAPR